MNKWLALSLLCSMALFANDPWNGATYHKHSEEQKAAAQKTLNSLTLTGNERILDIGSGDGFLTALMAQKVPEGSVVGIDLSPSMISFSSMQYSKIPKLHFRTLNALNLDYQEQFDLVTSFTTLHWVPDQLSVLVGIEHALCSGGKTIIDMPTSLPKPMLQAVDEIMIKKEWCSFFDGFSPGWRFFTVDEYQELLEQANLQVSKITQLPVPHTFPNKQAFTQFLKQWFPYIRPLPEDRKEIFLKEVVDRYLELFPADEQGKPTFIVNRLRVEAAKP